MVIDLFNNEIEQIDIKLSETISFLNTLNPRLPMGSKSKETLHQQLEAIDKQLELLIQTLENEV